MARLRAVLAVDGAERGRKNATVAVVGAFIKFALGLNPY
jgi:hypothetical protein